ncbi:hypothetical protein [Fluviispira sanaruensis]|uniref:Porin n=1 Tax=Fluviispira sanaruensis TaxID=2493639 RepID=A0A4P2VNB7_FLUSA|nr:hypothetical protein [Fluviispira sanaruensis]BBH53460.1 hypothetical protein JCM31447_19030 [Fluviispira sanaruensis]
MKRKVLRTLTVSALSLVGSTAFAQEATAENEGEKVAMDTGVSTGSSLISQEQIDALKKEVLKKDPTENAVKAYGLIQLNANLVDTTRSGTVDFSAAKVRFGILATGGIASGQFEVQFNGNQQRDLAVTSGTNQTAKSQGDGAVTIRRAQLNLDVLNIKSGANTFLTTLSLGGVRIGGADNSAPDAAITTNGYARQDGAYLKETITLGKAFSSEIGVGAFNNITAYTQSPGSYSGYGSVNNSLQANWMSTSFNGSLGYAGNVKLAYNFDDNKSLTGQFFYGAQSNAPSAQDTDGTVTKVKDVSHTEASLLYNDKAIFGSNAVIAANGIAVWYENESAGTTYTANKNSGGYSYARQGNATSGVDDSNYMNLIGLGVSGDTGNFFTGLMQKGDRLTYGIAYSFLESIYANQSNDTNDKNKANFSLNQVSAQIGYAVNTYEIALVADYKISEQAIFSNAKGDKVQNATTTYITAAYSF